MGEMKTTRKPARPGRPASGARGEKVSEYPQVMIRLPQNTKDVLDALSGATGTPVWRLVDMAVEGYIRSLPDSQRQLVARVQSLRAATGPARPE